MTGEPVENGHIKWHEHESIKQRVDALRKMQDMPPTRRGWFRRLRRKVGKVFWTIAESFKYMDPTMGER